MARAFANAKKMMMMEMCMSRMYMSLRALVFDVFSVKCKTLCPA